MTITIGSHIPSAELKALVNGEIKEIGVQSLLEHKKSVIFAVPGAFTATCSNDHLPSYVNQLAALKAKGIDQVICLAVNDIAVLKAWAEQHHATAIIFLADGSAALTKRMGLDIDLSDYGMGIRSKRYVMVVNNGIIKKLDIEESPGVCSISSATTLIDAL
ncbi:peroxiredoxin [Candidatus Odyssella acanthamoebae]|uniref:Glutathione-dependent peroxiredoxin n=1 Tax=Candidatus Odyssella acanthamoebae TaxID=91604 RepID=A0A077AYU2_9PROT|nr:peroxiredoxin [Candidatus Paracaedibacter acanthamoebae]AIK95880.1 alkyl hydroperoxide reductase [Candidatus Paracaedibacter acanthamoebae]